MSEKFQISASTKTFIHSVVSNSNKTKNTKLLIINNQTRTSVSKRTWTKYAQLYK